MKYLVTPLSISIIVLTLTACNDKTEQVGETVKETPQTEVTIKKPEDRSSKMVATSKEAPAPKETKPQINPINVDDFRSAIDDVVQDSIQESVESAVEDAVSKSAEQ